MPKYRVYLETTASLSLVVEASDSETAIDQAFEENPSGGLCAGCSGYSQDWELDLGDFDIAREQFKDTDNVWRIRDMEPVLVTDDES